MSYDQIEVPDDGKKITVNEEMGRLPVPDNPIIPIIHGDGIGTDVGSAVQKTLGAAAKATGRSTSWMRVYADLLACDKYDENLPKGAISAIRNHHVAIRDPLMTPADTGFHSLNAVLRKKFNFYVNVHPTYHLDGVSPPVKNPLAMDMVTSRENTEDVYANIEREVGTDEVRKVEESVEGEMGADSIIHDGPVGIGIKPVTEFGTKRLVHEAIEYTLENDHSSVTLAHKGSIMKFTEGTFCDWGYELIEEEFGDVTITEDELREEYDGERPGDKVVVKDHTVDNILQRLLTYTTDYDVTATMNFNGDYMFGAAGAQIGGLGIAPGVNSGEGLYFAEPVHGSVPKHVGEDKVNPTAIILSDRLMFEYMGWEDAGKLIYDAVEETISDSDVTHDLKRQIEGGNKLTTGKHAGKVVESIKELA